MKLAVLMDRLEGLDLEKDSTLAMLHEAHSRGWSCGYFTLKDLYAAEGQAFAAVTMIEVDASLLTWKVSAPQVQALQAFDIILIRKDPPFNLSYLYATQILELAERQGVLVSNPPQVLRDHNEKLSILQYPGVYTPTLVTADMQRLKAFWQTHHSVIFKPLDAMGGRSVFHVKEDGCNLPVILETLTALETTTIMAQRYIPAISQQGDKRILLINGEPIPFALARFPKAGEARANLVVGGQGTVVPITERDRALCDLLAPRLRAQRLYFVGIDVIGDFVTEINITSPTCARHITAATGIDICGKYLDVLADMAGKP